MQINWNVFTAEEREMIESLLSKKEFNLIPKAIMMDSQEKEYWIQQIIDGNKPIPAPLDSKVEKELQDALMHGKQIETPEHAEKAAHIEKVKAKRGRPAKIKTE
jgi:hypothetical protein